MAVPVPRGYSNQYLVADAIGKHDGVAPVQSLPYWLAAAETWIDNYTGRSWGLSTVTAEIHTFDGCYPSPQRFGRYVPYNALYYDRVYSVEPAITLRVTPVTAVTAVRARYLTLGATTTLLSASDYELVDGALGQLLVSYTYFGRRLSIDYTVDATVPADIALAATLLVAAWVAPMTSETATQSMSGIKSYSIGQDLSVTFEGSSGSSMKLGAPAKVLEVLEPYRNWAYVS